MAFCILKLINRCTCISLRFYGDELIPEEKTKQFTFHHLFHNTMDNHILVGTLELLTKLKHLFLVINSDDLFGQNKNDL
jgi:hypothetical protein